MVDSPSSKELFGRLQTAEAIKALIGRAEDVHFDCKEWPASDSDAQKLFAKAACGLTNAEGGVLIIGMRARATSKDEPDLVEAAAAVTDTRAVKSRVLDLVGQLVEPGIEGVQAAEINPSPDSKSGFVVVYIPSSEGSPRRSRKDWKFYLRIGSGTFPMEYFQIEERFGRRPLPKLELYLELEGIGRGTYDPMKPERTFVLGLRNVGYGIAKFPSLRYRRASGLGVSRFGIDGSMGFGLPQRPSENEWAVFRGGVNDVIYPGETRKITKLLQMGQKDEFGTWVLATTTFQCEISCEGTPTITFEKLISEESTVGVA